MKKLIIGAGNVGTAIAFYLSSSFPETISLLDAEKNALDKFTLITKTFTKKCNVELINQNVFSKHFFKKLISEYEVVISTLPWSNHVTLCKILKNYPILLIGIARPDSDYYRDMLIQHEITEATIIHGCGLEPGLSEIFTQHLTKQFSKINEVTIECGGIPKELVPPLDYKLVFGGDNLPFQLRKTLKIDQGRLCVVPRFGEINELVIESVGTLECWNDGLTPWLAEYLIQKGVLTCTQKTIRWPGYARVVQFLHQAGFLSEDSIDMTKKILLPHLQLATDEIDMVIQRICVKGITQNTLHKSSLELIDYKDRQSGLSAMARTTGFSAALIARFFWERKQLFSNEHMITDCYSPELFDYLHLHLKNSNIKINVNFSYEIKNAN